LDPRVEEFPSFCIPLTREQFAAALCKGQGRAVLHVKQCGITGFEDLLLDACVHSRVFDAQSEGTRGEWLFRLLESAGLKDRVRPVLVQALQAATAETTDTWTVAQLMALASMFASEGHEDCRKAIYTKFDLQEFRESWLGGHEIIALDGLEGLLHVAEVLGARLLREPDYWEDDYLVDLTAEDHGREAVMAVLRDRARSDDRVRAYLAEVQRHEAATATRPPLLPLGLHDVLRMIEEAAVGRLLPLGYWGCKASDEELAAIVSRMRSETRVAQLRNCLRVFRIRPLPELLDDVFRFVVADDGELREAAIRALSHSHDDRVRGMALDLLKSVPARLDGLSLFSENYQSGDECLWTPLLPHGGDECMLHGIVIDVLRIADNVKAPELKNTLVWAYEYTPCSFCRGGIVARLIDGEAIPRAVLEECLWDCQDDTRELAASTLDSAPTWLSSRP